MLDRKMAFDPRRLREDMAAKKMSAQAVAWRLAEGGVRVTAATVWNWKTGRTGDPPGRAVVALARVFGRPPEDYYASEARTGPSAGPKGLGAPEHQESPADGPQGPKRPVSARSRATPPPKSAADAPAPPKSEGCAPARPKSSPQT